MLINIFPDNDELHRAVSKEIIQLVKTKPDSVLGLSTGSSPVDTYALLVDDYKKNKTDYSSIVTFNLDEYVGLDAHHDQSYRHFMNFHLFNHLNIPADQTHVPLGTGDLDNNCQEYEALIQEAGGIDLQLLGIGTNGHIGFNEPGTSFESRTHVAPLLKDTIEANSRFFETSEEVPTKAVTMGIKTIMEARKIILLAYGSHKAAAVRDMVNGEVSEDLPASILQKHEHVALFLDEEAASLLQ
ncbi:glucosamine-6-phosphate deaminase [Cyclobacterium lianum]|uniref:Glucosamine-6-phosphate deaminase n=1 Tax=Cyclobacterium lianum TaxID=388280 RepID=A0A1M7IJF7_9BACT|nr:glucosamine-6-phosphate deaminase [Cyclobacterium lianum]SHM40795.1 glucosamine-6-phosphate deaminase [Cyclobacterium lianum]